MTPVTFRRVFSFGYLLSTVFSPLPACTLLSCAVRLGYSNDTNLSAQIRDGKDARTALISYAGLAVCARQSLQARHGVQLSPQYARRQHTQALS